MAVISAVPAVMSSTETYPKKNEQSASRPFPGGFLFWHRLTINRQSPSESPVIRGGFSEKEPLDMLLLSSYIDQGKMVVLI
jgi:hypothetical protein